MRWFLSQNGEVGGPYDELQIAQWRNAGQLRPGALVQPEVGGPWLPVERTSIGRKPFKGGLLFAGVLLAALLSCGAFAAVISSRAEALKSEPVTDSETPVPTLALELGEGDARGVAIPFWTVPEGAKTDVVSGTRIERLREKPSHVRPSSVPRCEHNPGCMARVRITSGEYAGAVGYVHSYQVQAAR